MEDLLPPDPKGILLYGPPERGSMFYRRKEPMEWAVTPSASPWRGTRF